MAIPEYIFSYKIAKTVNDKDCVLCCRFWFKSDLGMLGTSKWLSEAQLCERY